MKRANEGTVFVVDDDEAVRDALSMMLRASGFEVETFASANLFLARRRPGVSGCLVLDVRMPGMSGLELQEHLAQRQSALPIVFLTGHGDVPMAVRAIKRGAFDFVQKPIDDRHLLSTVIAALAFAATSVQSMARPTLPAAVESLSRREREVLDLILAGRQTRAIAEALFISTKTVEFHRGRIHEKLGVSSLAELFSLCFAQDQARPRAH